MISWLLLLCFICSAVSLPVQATDYKTIDQLGIDPWGDMEKLPGTVYHQKPDTVIFPTEDIAELPEGGEVVPDFVPFALPQGSYSLVGDGSTSTYYQFYVGDSASVSVNGKTTFDFSKGFNPLKSSPGTSSNGYNARVWKGHYWDLSSEVSYSASGNSKVYLNGTFGFYPYITYDNSSGVSSSASFTEGLFTIQLMVNGKLVGSSVSGTRLRLSNYELDLSKLGNIYSIGARLSIVQGDTISNGSTIKDAMGGVYVLDSLSVVADEKGDSGSEETNCLLNTILGWLKSIFDGINNIAIAIVELPGKIVNAIIDGLKSLFVPSEEDLAAIQEQYKTLLSERLGFVWQAGELVIDFGSSVLSALEGATDYSFHFPGVHLSLPEGEYDLIAAQDVSLDNPLTAVLRPVLGTIVSFLVVAAFVNTAERMVVAFVSGKSYFDFLKGDGEE